jgi:hypothetical protein
MGEYMGSGLDNSLGGGMGLGGFGGGMKLHVPVEEQEEGTASDKKSGKKSKSTVKVEESTKSDISDNNTKSDTKVENTAKSDKAKKEIKADTKSADRLVNEFKGGSLDSMLGMGGAMGGFGVTLSFEDDDEEVIVGHYNEKGQWVDEDGYVYNGYFDENGDWKDYEAFDSKEEGSYNDQGQWVDKDGKVYDGYFDEKGRWIDYTYVNEKGETVDNGYYDKKIGKWMPFGYFAEDGSWKEYK